MRRVPSDELRRATTNVVGSTSYYALQPKVDGRFVADTFEAALYKKNFNISGPVVVIHAEHETFGAGEGHYLRR